MKTMIIATLALFASAHSVTAAPMTVEGTLYYPFAAIGGETTGMAVNADDGSFTELEIADPTLLNYAQSLDRKRVTATGELKMVTGVEIPSRNVLVVTTLQELVSGPTCTADNSAYSTVFAADMNSAAVYNAGKKVADLVCSHGSPGSTSSNISCYEPNLRDAGYAFSYVGSTVRLSEVYIWGAKQVATLACH